MGKYGDILGINRRNVEYIYEYNDRKDYPLADDKLLSKKVLTDAGLPTPKLIRAYRYYFQLSHIAEDLKDKGDFVIKPAHGMGGGGILIFDRHDHGVWYSASGEGFNKDQIYLHGTMILNGVYSLDNTADAVMVEEKIQLDDVLEAITYKGIPDIRVIIYNHIPVMGMLRVPTKKSAGKANLHSGGIGLGIDLDTGVTTISPHYRKHNGYNPESGVKLTGIEIPYWKEMLSISKKVQEVVPLGYMGIDFVIDKRYGPQILELNVRPGLEIQNVNGLGLAQKLVEVSDAE